MTMRAPAPDTEEILRFGGNTADEAIQALAEWSAANAAAECPLGILALRLREDAISIPMYMLTVTVLGD
ncbi:hypothetical protein [Streptomyces tsukubensis]|uniref:hypothetical protein n=1 Tax=Streptomyces tsukubensis TaxID=83656 RepID=UPI00344BC3B6